MGPALVSGSQLSVLCEAVFYSKMTTNIINLEVGLHKRDSTAIMTNPQEMCINSNLLIGFLGNVFPKCLLKERKR